MKYAMMLMLLLAAGCYDSLESNAPTRNGTNGTASQMGAQNQLSDPSQNNVNRVETMPQDGENAAVGGANGALERPARSSP